jgi:hypothetical protein
MSRKEKSKPQKQKNQAEKLISKNQSEFFSNSCKKT